MLIVNRASLPPTYIQDQRCNGIGVFNDVLEIDAALEPMAGLRTEFETAGPSHDGLRPPICGFYEDVGGIQGDCRRFAAHDTGKTFHLIACGDHTYFGIELYCLTVEKLERLTLAGPTYGQTIFG